MTELSESVRQQFDRAPFPRQPLERSPQDDLSLLYRHTLVTPFYKRDGKVIETQNLTVLDAGCGSGYKALALAIANPEISIVGVDFSESSIELARHRLNHHHIDNVEFHAMSLEDVGNLGREFDYINCDEVLYLLPNPVAGLRSLASVLKPHGIVRGNLHSAFQRFDFFRAQQLFNMMGLMGEDIPDEMAIDLVRETMNALKDFAKLKSQTWTPKLSEDPERLFANYLLREDKGFTVPQLFEMLEAAELEFISMVNWRQWNPLDLFDNPDDLPAFLGMSLPKTTIAERLHLYELIHPIHRLLDFWCGCPGIARPRLSVENWTNWEAVRVSLHPLLKTSSTRAALETCLHQHRGFSISEYLPVPGVTNLFIDSVTAASLLPLFDAPKSMFELVAFWNKTHPLNPVTLEATTQTEALDAVRDLMVTLEDLGFVMLEMAR
ncbi:class I SAM-dependent methyltransferase [Baaleninema simplex]|uniref:class I SAM-dependent methyltransferase n=1 Tax=Baaleninema simplex TaxID=2862350 RepID=UPI00034764A3|nr:methyltransferase domain-containing protein [Baaleninema simplex]